MGKIVSAPSGSCWQRGVYTLTAPSYLPTRMVFGPGALEILPDVLKDVLSSTGATRIVLITGRQSAEKPWQEQVRRAVARYPYHVIVSPKTNPTLASVAAVASQCGPPGGELFVALGGGSVIDTTKSVAAMIGSERSIGELLRDPTGMRAAPMIAIPTTAGSGSEVTPTATLWDDSEARKFSLAGPALFPRAAIVDPDVTLSLPPDQVAATGLDALAQAVEGAWAVGASEESAGFALAAAERLYAHLVRRHRDPADAERRAQVSLGALLAGIAIAHSRTTAAHAISYPLTARWGVPHGHACALSLGALLRFNASLGVADCQDLRGPDHVTRVINRLVTALHATGTEQAAAHLDSLVPLLGLRRFQ